MCIPRRHPGTRLLTLMAVLAALLSACARMPAPEGVAIVRAAVNVEDADAPTLSLSGEAVGADSFREKSFEGYGAGKHPTAASGEVQSRTFARAEARRAALRALAKEILKHENTGGTELRAALGDAHDWEDVLEQSLERRARVDYRTRNDVELARARIQGAHIFKDDAPDAPTDVAFDDGLSPELLDRRATAKELAIDAAREILLAELLPYGGRRGFLGGTRPAPPAFEAALRNDLETVAPVGVEFTADGQCVVEMHYDRGRLRKLSH
jgi:hypothetical protein